MEWMSQPWPWYVAGPMIALVMGALMVFGKKFGVSSNLETLCSMSGAGRFVEYFNVDWKKKSWNLVFILGTVIGGYIAHNFLNNDNIILISDSTISALEQMNIAFSPEILPLELFSWEALFSTRGVIILIGGGVLVGFGTRYAGGCTSGHAISGLSNLQLPSLVAVIGFFIGGLLMTHFILPLIISL